MSGGSSIIASRFAAAVRAGLALAAALALSGCGALRIGYATGPDAAYWWFDRYVDFDGDQTPTVREAIARWFDWHRRTQLPDYAEQLRRARSEVVADTTPERVCAWQGELTKRARLTFDRFVPSIAAFLPTTTPRQAGALEHRYAKLDADFRADYLQPDPRRRAEKAAERVVDRAETLYGRLDAAQRERIAAALARSPFDPATWLAERQWRQQQTLELVRAAMGGAQTAAQAQAAVVAHADRVERSPHPEYRRYVERLSAFNCAFVAEIHNATTPAQRRTAAERLEGWEDDLRAIVASRPPAPRVEP